MTWSANCIIVFTAATNQDAIFAITDIKCCVSVVNLLTQGNIKLSDQSKSGFKNIKWNKY